MWALYLAYENHLDMQEPFDPIAEARKAGASVPKTTGAGTPVDRAGNTRVVVESVAQTDIFYLDLEITLARTNEGAVAANVGTLAAGWRTEN
jgi:hypothetical protein